MRLLLAEDDVKLARALDAGLRRAGYGVDVAHDGDTALLNARVHDYDAAVLDVMMPALDGVEVCRTLRDEERWLPVLLLTARDQVPDRIRGLDAGADDYLVKPFDFGELLARLRALVRRGPIPRPAAITVGALRVDPAAHTVTLGGAALDLTAREFAVLEFLARRPGEVVPRTEIIEHVWDRNWFGSMNIVDVYVGYLRRKAGPRLITTVRGVGYRLDPP
jgi:two-component system OmpR family response regulator